MHVKISPRLLALLHDAISLRKEANQFLEGYAFGDGTRDEKNEGHRYAIAALEEMAKKVERLRAPKTRHPRTVPGTPGEAESPTGNSFEALDVEQLSDPIVDATKSADTNYPQPAMQFSKGKKAKQASNSGRQQRQVITTSNVEVDSSDDDLFVLLFYFYKDLGEVRRYLADRWKNYHDSRMTLVSAALTADLAFDVVRRLETQLLESEVVIGGRRQSLQSAYDHVASRQKRSGIAR